MKQLIVDYLPFEVRPEQITESMKENNGKLIVRGVLQRAEAKNQNGRIYPKEVLVREAKKYYKEFIKQSRAMGELDHPESSVVNLANVSHNIKEMHWEGDNLLGTVEVLGTPSGNILKELFKAGIKLGISSRGLGSVKEMNEELPKEQQLRQSTKTVLFGKDGKLDSLGLVSFLVTIEQNIEDEFDVSITIADERAMSQKHSPFRTISTLADYIDMLLRENQIPV